MATHIRKLLPPDGNSTQTLINTSSSSFSSSSSLKVEERENLNPTFDSAMALTVLALLIALLFFSFLSIYARQFSGDSSRRSRRRSSSSPAYFSTTASYKAKGVDPTTIQSLPVHAHGGGGAKQGIKPDPDMEIMECAICLGEFEEREWVKEIPYCGHVFHVECIDTWLSSHVTCPLCRTAKLFPPEKKEKEKEEGSGVGEVQGDEVRLVVDECDTWHGGEREVGPLGHVRRSSSCSSRFDERMTLHRSLSF